MAKREVLEYRGHKVYPHWPGYDYAFTAVQHLKAPTETEEDELRKCKLALEYLGKARQEAQKAERKLWKENPKSKRRFYLQGLLGDYSNFQSDLQKEINDLEKKLQEEEEIQEE